MTQNWLKKIQALLNIAEDESTTPEAADAHRAMAEKIMHDKRISEEELSGTSELPSLVPTEATVDVCLDSSPYRSSYDSLASSISYHCQLRGVFRYRREEGRLISVMEVHGYQSDIDYFEMLYTAARLTFSEHLEPSKDEDLDDQVNIYRMRRAGMTRIRIAQLMGYGTDQGSTAKVTKLYKAECKRLGVNPSVAGQGFSLKTYVQTYRDTFVETVWQRLYKARNAVDGNDGAVVLASRKDKVDEAFYEKYPQFKPSEDKKEYTPPKRSKRDEARMHRQSQNRIAAMLSPSGQAGNSAGYSAAHAVDIAGVKAPKRI